MTDIDSVPELPTWPPTLVPVPGGGFAPATAPLDSEDEIRSHAALLCEIHPGQLVWAKRAGTPTGLGVNDDALVEAQINAALADQEPRLPIRARLVSGPGAERSIRLRVARED